MTKDIPIRLERLNLVLKKALDTSVSSLSRVDHVKGFTLPTLSHTNSMKEYIQDLCYQVIEGIRNNVEVTGYQQSSCLMQCIYDAYVSGRV